MYQPRRIFASHLVPVRHLDYHVLTWGEPQPGKPPLVLLHGWMDVAASWQFMVDALREDHFIVAADWRGYGLTEVIRSDTYWIPDYLADLDFLLDHFSPDAPVNLVGHSMGGNIAMGYSGARPARVRRLVNLEGFGMAATRPAQAPARFARWMDELKAFHRGEMGLRPYASAHAVAQRLMRTNPRLGRDKADWLAQHWARQDAQGQWTILADPAHKVVNANLYQLEETLALYRAITAPVLAIESDQDNMGAWFQGRYTLADYHERLTCVPQVRIEAVGPAGHMVHHDQPEKLAALIEPFLAD